MLLLIFSLLLTILILRSCFMLIWRNKKDKRFFAPLHFIIITIASFFSFCCMYLMALGSIGHHVPTDFEELISEWTIGVSLAGTLLGIIGFITAIIVWIKNFIYQKRK